MKKLREKFSKGQRDFERVYEDDNWYIYRVTLHHHSPDADETFFEVFKKRVKRISVFDSEHKSWVVTDDKGEIYPSDECFGDWAWCCNTLERCKLMMERHPIKDDAECEI